MIDQLKKKNLISIKLINNTDEMTIDLDST